MSTGGGYRVPAVVGAVRALEALAGLSGAGATLSEVARTIGRSKSTVFNLLHTLEDEGLVVRDPGTSRDHLGARLVPLGAAAARETRPLAMAMTLARRITFEEGVTVAVAQVVGGITAQVVENATPPSGLHVGLTIGDRFGVFDGACGRARPAPRTTEPPRTPTASWPTSRSRGSAAGPRAPSRRTGTTPSPRRSSGCSASR